MTSPTTLADAIRVVTDVPREYRSCSDADLLTRGLEVAELKRLVDAHAALVVGEVARRSAPKLGGAGLATRAGHRTVEDFVKHTIGVTGRDAGVLTRVGKLTQEAGVIGTAVREGTLGAASAESIRAGLGSATVGVPVEVLEQAAEKLCVEARGLDPDGLHRRAREVRDEIDAAGIPDRESHRRAQRSLRLVRQSDGLTRIVWVLDPESAVIVTDVYDRATSPRRGGPRFVDPEKVERFDSIRDDDRSTEQLASDAFTELLRQSTSVDESVLVGSGAPAVRVLVAAKDLESRTGHGVIEGSNETVSIETVERIACTTGTHTFVIDDDGAILNQGRDQRLFTTRQKTALAVRDGGCRIPGCERPPSWCEAHHINHWARDHGRTDLHDGILLCRHHHLKLHNEGWDITRRGGTYWLEPPPNTGKIGTLLPTKSRAIRELLESTG